MSKFEDLVAIDCSEFIEDKQGLSYLSWASAWELLKKHCPDASYEHHEWQVLPSGEVMCYCTVTVESVSHKAHLPVHKGFQSVVNPSLFQINTTMQRCFAKAIAMHGLGLYVYRGEDLPTQPVLSPYEAALDKVDDPMDFHEFVHTLDEISQGMAFNGAARGEKTAWKKRWQTTINAAEGLLQESLQYILEGIHQGDAVKVSEHWSELSDYESDIIWSRLGVQQKACKELLKELENE